MSIMFITDLHLDIYRPFHKILSNGMNSRLLDQLNVVKATANRIKERKPKAVIFLGDLYNGITDSMHKIIYNAGFLTAKAWSEDTELYIIVGNHDIYRGMHVFSAFESLPNVHIISQTTKVNIDGYEIDMIPWENPLPSNKGDVCVGHMEVHGAMMDAAYACKTGILPTNFTGYSHVLLGHFHNPQEFLVDGCTQARYIGSIMQTDRRRSSEGFMGIVELEGEDRILSYHSIDSPRIYDVIINSQEEYESFVKKMEGTTDYYKMIIRNPEIKNTIDSHRVSVEYDLPEIITSRLDTSKEGTWAENLQNSVVEYINKSNTVLDKDKLIELAKELIL